MRGERLVGWERFVAPVYKLIFSGFFKRVDVLHILTRRACASAIACLALWGGGGLAALGTTSVYAQEVRVAAVNSDRILRESALAKKAKDKLEQEFAARGQELQKMEQRLKNLSEAYTKKSDKLSGTALLEAQHELSQFDEKFQRKQREFREELNRRRNEEIANVLEQANEAILQVAEKEHYDLVLQEAVYVNPRIDITDKVIKLLANGAR